jgi:cysteinyl-tRNA synthetase
MVTIRLHNSKTRQREVFSPIDPENVRIYVCGPTVYDRAHLGNARPVVVFDTLYRLLRHVYDGKVTYVRNFTDVDDKINATALARQQAGAAGTLEALIAERTEETIGWYHADMDALGALRPDHEPRATAYIGAMIGMIEGLIAKGHAYAADGHVLFDVRSYPDYGHLSGRSVDDMIAGARVEVAPYKRDPMDFVLWKPSDENLPGWDSPWGRGRPGWHIECSAMSLELLGPSFDIHGGGIDLQFPHHENEVAQSCCAHPEASFAKVWMHNEMLQVEGKKMSKSLGNFFTVRDLLDQGIPGEVIRLVFLGTHYGKPMDWTAEKATDTIDTLRKWRFATNDARLGSIDEAALNCLANDLDTAGFITRLHALYEEKSYEDLLATARLAGLLTDELRWVGKFDLNNAIAERLEKVWKLYELARTEKSFGTIDNLKNSLQASGITLKFGKSSVDIGTIDMLSIFRSFNSMDDDQRRLVFGDAYKDYGSEKSIQHEALSYAYVASALDRFFEKMKMSEESK